MSRYFKESELEKKFSSVGKVVKCNVLLTPGKFDSIGYVQFSSHEEALNAVQTLNGCELDRQLPKEMKRVLEVRLSSEKK